MSMQPTARVTLVELVRDHITGLIRDAVHVQRHQKRTRLHENSINEDGSSSSSSNARPLVRRRLHAADINMALQLNGSEKLYATDIVPPDPADTTRKISLQDFLRTSAERMPAPPSEISYHMRWLAVDGIAPEGSSSTSSSSPPQVTAAATTTTRSGGATGASAASTTTTTTLRPAGVLDSSNSSSSHKDQQVVAAAGGGMTDSSATTTPTPSLRVNQLQSSLLSEELQLYFSRVTTAMERGATVGTTTTTTTTTRQQQDTVLLSVSRDPGLQELVPFLVRYCQQELYKYITTTSHLEHCRTLVRLARALLENPHLHLELHLHELLPVLMTCVVAKKLPSSDHHWMLRREAAQTLLEACDMFGTEYSTLKARVLRALCDAVIVGTTTTATTRTGNGGKPPSSSLASRYGGTVGITLFGARAIDAFLLPSIMASWEDWELALQDPKMGPERTMEIHMCQQASLDALCVFLRQVSASEKAARLDRQDLEEVLGDRLIYLEDGVNEYTMCFV